MDNVISYIAGVIIGVIIGLLWFHEPHTIICKDTIHKCRESNSITKKEK